MNKTDFFKFKSVTFSAKYNKANKIAITTEANKP